MPSHKHNRTHHNTKHVCLVYGDVKIVVTETLEKSKYDEAHLKLINKISALLTASRA